MAYKTLSRDLITIDPTGKTHIEFYNKMARYHHDCALLGLAVTTEDPRKIYFREAVQASYLELVTNIREVNTAFREQIPPINILPTNKKSVDELVLGVLTDLFNNRSR